MLCALQVVEEVDLFKPTTYHEVITCVESYQWTVAMNEDI